MNEPQPMGSAARREALQRQCALQREQLHEAVTDLQGRLHFIDRGVLALKRVRLGPALLAVAAAVATAVPLFRSLGRALLLMRTVKGLLSSRR